MKKWAVLSLLSAAMFIIVIDTTIMNVSISALVEDLNTTVGGVQAAISIYALVMASFILIGGKLADIVGKKRTFIIGLIIFGIGTTTASFSQGLGLLIIGWSILEGLGSALMMPNVQTLLRDEYEGKDRAFSYGIIGAVGAVGAAVGPIVGGFLTTFASWRWAFRLEVLIVILVLVFSGYIKPDVVPERRPKFDYLGALLNILGWVLIVLAILLGGSYGFWLAKQPFVIGDLEIAPFGLSIVPFMIGAGVLVIMLLFRWERRLEEKDGDGLFRPSLFRIPGLPSGFAVRFTQMAITAAFLFIFPLLLQLSFEFTAMETGVALVPFSIALLITAIVGARLSARFKAKRIIQVGFIIAIIGLITMEATIQPESTPADLATGALFGAGLGLIASQILNLILSSVKPADTAETAGLNGTFEQLGNSLGVALVGTIMLVSLSTGLQEGIDRSAVIPGDDKAVLSAAVEESVELVSNTQLAQGLEDAGVDETVEAEVIDIYGVARTQAFKAGIAFLIFVALGGLILTGGLSNRKLVGEEVEEEDV
ncbi:MAG: MFS transporter [Anaerolineae bacterium]|nr:MFS transporter [Anaerolineae bacterium]